MIRGTWSSGWLSPHSADVRLFPLWVKRDTSNTTFEIDGVDNSLTTQAGPNETFLHIDIFANMRKVCDKKRINVFMHCDVGGLIMRKWLHGCISSSTMHCTVQRFAFLIDRMQISLGQCTTPFAWIRILAESDVKLWMTEFALWMP